MDATVVRATVRCLQWRTDRHADTTNRVLRRHNGISARASLCLKSHNSLLPGNSGPIHCLRSTPRNKFALPVSERFSKWTFRSAMFDSKHALDMPFVPRAETRSLKEQNDQTHAGTCSSLRLFGRHNSTPESKAFAESMPNGGGHTPKINDRSHRRRTPPRPQSRCASTSQLSERHNVSGIRAL